VNLTFSGYKDSQNVTTAIIVLSDQKNIITNHQAVNGSGIMSQLNVTNITGGEFNLNDTNWFSGSVIRYGINCTDCGDKIKLRNRIELNHSIFLNVNNIQDLKVDNNQSIYVL